MKRYIITEDQLRKIEDGDVDLNYVRQIIAKCRQTEIPTSATHFMWSKNPYRPAIHGECIIVKIPTIDE